MSKRENLIVTVEEIKLQEMYIEKVAEKVKTKFVTGKPGSLTLYPIRISPKALQQAYFFVKF